MRSRSLLAATWEIKHLYQRNLAVGFGISGLGQLIIVTLCLVLAFSQHPLYPIVIPFDSTTIMIPPSIQKGPLPSSVETPQRILPKIGILIPVPDTEISVSPQIPTMADIAALSPTMPVDILNLKLIIDTQKVVQELLPSSGTFTPCDEMPVAISTVQPEYPDLARRTGLQGIVWLDVLIDKNGDVRDVVVMKCNNKDMGFEDAAVAAARKSIWKPAIANGLPVAVWVSYSVVFKLH